MEGFYQARDELRHRILFVIPSLDRAGAEKQLVLLATGLPRDEFEVSVCALTRGGPRHAELEAARIPIVVLGKRAKLDPWAFWKLERHLTHEKPDLVHTWLFAGNAYGRAAARAAGVPYVVAGERCVDAWKSAYQLALDRWLARYTDRIVVNSTAVRDFYVARGLHAHKFMVIPGGVPAAAPSHLSRERLLAKLHLPPQARLIGAVGRLWPQKRVKDLIWAADLLHLAEPQAHLLVMGDGPERFQLEQFVRKLEASRHILMLGERADVAGILPHLDVFWQGSAYEGLPNAVMEAMAAAVPVVASDIPGHRDLVVPDKTGLLVPVAARAERVRASLKILGDPAWARKLGEAGREKIAHEFRVETMIQRHVEMYREILSSGGR